MDLIFDEFETYREAALGWGLEFVQLDRGPFHGVLRQAASPRVALTHFSLNRRFYQQGEIRAPGRTFAIFLNRVSPMRWRNSPLVDADTLVIFPKDGALEALTVPGFDAVSISVDEAFLADVARQHDLERSFAAVPGHAMNVQTDGRLVEALRGAVRQLLRLSGQADPAGDFDAARVRHDTECDIAGLILRALAVHLPQNAAPSPRKRDRAFAAALELLGSASHPPTVPELCRMVGASERTLRYAFRERLGVSPKHYINAHRLKTARDLLLGALDGALLKGSSLEENAPVQDAAAQAGYWHTGQFAADYKAMFGELPSETLLRRTPRHRAA